MHNRVKYLRRWADELKTVMVRVNNDNLEKAISHLDQLADEVGDELGGDENDNPILRDVRECEKLVVEGRLDDALTELQETRDALEETADIVSEVSDEVA